MRKHLSFVTGASDAAFLCLEVCYWELLPSCVCISVYMNLQVYVRLYPVLIYISIYLYQYNSHGSQLGEKWWSED